MRDSCRRPEVGFDLLRDRVRVRIWVKVRVRANPNPCPNAGQR